MGISTGSREPVTKNTKVSWTNSWIVLKSKSNALLVAYFYLAILSGVKYEPVSRKLELYKCVNCSYTISRYEL